MRNKIFTLLLAVTVLTGGAVNAQLRESKQLGEKAKKEVLSPEIAESCPTTSPSFSDATKAMWDVLKTFSVQAAGGGYGVETDGQFIYVTYWGGANIEKYTLAGTFVETFTIPGVTGLRDLAFDGTHFYGGANAASIFKMDFTLKTLVATITATGQTVRHISYDPTANSGAGGLWIGGWSNLSLVSMTGSVLAGPYTVSQVGGSAYDDVSAGGPYLWFFTQTQGTSSNPDNLANIQQWNISTQALTAVANHTETLPGFIQGIPTAKTLAGGLGITKTVYPGKVAIIGCVQQAPNLIFVYEVATTVPATAPGAATALTAIAAPAGALTADISWNNPAVDVVGNALTELTSVSLYHSSDMVTPIFTSTTPVIGGAETFNATVLAAGNHTFRVKGTNSAGTGLTAQVTVYIGEDRPAAPTNVTLTKLGMVTTLTWTAPAAGLNGGYINPSNVIYDVFRLPGNVQVATGQAETTFSETIAVPGNYSYRVVAKNAIGVGGEATSNVLLVGDFIVYEMFDGATIPTGWAAMGLGLTNWSVQNTANAGGTAREVRFTWTPSFTGATHFVSPVINTSGYYSLTLNYKDMFDDYNTTPKTIGLKTTVDGGATWLVVNQEVMANGNVNVGPRNNQFVINNAHVGNPNFRFAFFFDGNTFNMDHWYIDNVTLTGVLAVGANVTFAVKEGATPIEGAVVNINSNNYTTNAAGVVSPFILAGTDIPYTVTKFGYADATGTITVVNGVNQDVEVQMVSLTTYNVTFNIADVNSNPLNAFVALKKAGATVASGTAAAGTITFGGIPNGNYSYEVSMQNYLSATGDFTVAGADVVVPNIVLNYNPNITIGTGNVTGKPYPVDPFWGFTYSQSIYLKSEIASTPTTITHVKYYFNGATLSNSNNWTIYMGHTSKSAFASTTDWVPLAQLTQVYSAEFANVTGPGWIEFDITDFVYNGIDNLVIAVDENKPNYNGSSDRFLASSVAGNRSIAYRSDTTNPNPASPPTASVTEAFIPNTILTAYPKPGANLTFIVTDGTNPIEGAVIGIESKLLTTPANGTVVVYISEGTNIPYTVNKFGFQEFAGTVTVVDGVAQNVNVTMVPLAKFNVTVNIKNILGDNLNATVTAFFDGTQVASQTAVNGVTVFNNVPTGTYTYNVVFAGYQSLLNQTLVVDADKIVNVELIEIFTPPYGLAVNVVGNNANFSWNNALGFFDNFESYPNFSLTFAPWILNDVDGDNTYGFQGVTFPNSGVPMAGIIFNPSATTPAITTSPAYSGSKYVAIFNDAVAPYQNDDWVIAPKTLIIAGDQVSFWARGGNASFVAEKFQVFVSTTGTAPANFTSISPVITTPSTTWIQYTYSLNSFAGQEVHVAIRCTSQDQFYLCIDDFRIGQPAKTKSFESYSVYLNGAEVATGVTATNYSFTGLAAGNYTAGVKSVYTTGASEIVTTGFVIAAPPTYTVTFNVVNEANAPITDAVITFNGVAAPAGSYVFANLLPGTYSYSVAKGGFEVITGNVTVINQNVTVPVTLIQVGIDTNTLANLSAYPNPFSSSISISNPAVVSRVVVANIIGQNVLDIRTNGAASIGTASLPAGIYMVTFEAANGERLVRKMVKK